MQNRLKIPLEPFHETHDWMAGLGNLILPRFFFVVKMALNRDELTHEALGGFDGGDADGVDGEFVRALLSGELILFSHFQLFNVDFLNVDGQFLG